MIVEKELKAIPLPAIYKREGKECYYDTYRKKLIEITPEETVRQRVAAYFENECGVPKEMISLEVPMSYYVKGVAGRADIIVHAYDLENDCIYPVTIIECKKEDVLLTDNVVEQAMRYCDALGGKYIVITNGIEMKMFVYQDESNSYALLDEILPYKKMLSDDYVIPDFKTEKLIRLSMEELKDQKVLMDYNEQGTWIFGSDSSPEVRNFAVNFYQALLDVDHRLPAKKFKTFEMLEDFGIPVMIEYSSYEKHPLGRVEWVRFFGTLLGKEKEAEKIFEKQKDILKKVTADEKTDKTVAFFYITSNGLVQVRQSSDYIPKMIELAGGKYIFEDLGDEEGARSTVNMQIEDFYQGAKDADYLIYNSTIDGGVSSIEELLDKCEVLKDFKAVKNGDVWCTTNDMYQQSMSMGYLMQDIHSMLLGENEQKMKYLFQLK